jgi:hypothetical protein
MTPEQAKAQQEALEALIAASLLAPGTETEVTNEEIGRYVSQNVTLSAEDEAALVKAKPHLHKAITEILKTKDKQGECAHRPEQAEGAQFAKSRSRGSTSDEFVEAVLIAQLTREISTPQFPLGHLRQNKLVYFAHRKADEDVAGHFLKKAAGPYSQWATYKGPERIAQENRYVRKAKVGSRVGFLVGENINKIDQYISRYPVCAAVDWVVSHFRYKKNDELELFTTVDFAALDLAQEGTPITMENVKRIIGSHGEWSAKLQREVFSDANITRALAELRKLFPGTYA